MMCIVTVSCCMGQSKVDHPGTNKWFVMGKSDDIEDKDNDDDFFLL